MTVLLDLARHPLATPSPHFLATHSESRAVYHRVFFAPNGHGVTHRPVWATPWITADLPTSDICYTHRNRALKIAHKCPFATWPSALGRPHYPWPHPTCGDQTPQVRHTTRYLQGRMPAQAAAPAAGSQASTPAYDIWSQHRVPMTAIHMSPVPMTTTQLSTLILKSNITNGLPQTTPPRQRVA